MQRETIVVTGSNGMLGYAVSEYFKRQGGMVRPLSRKDFDISKDGMEKLAGIIKGADVVINCAGVIRQRMGEYSIEEVLKVNSIFPVNLARLCESLNIMCFHITTDCVFSGKNGPYSESDFFDAEDTYGMSKNAGDTDKCMTLRTSIIGEEKCNYKSLLSWVISQRSNTVNGYTDHLWNGVTTLYLAEIIEKIIHDNLYQKGIFHIHSKEALSKYEMIRMISRVYDLNVTVTELSTGSPCDRSLKSEKLLNDMLVVKSFEAQLLEMKHFFETTGEPL